MTQPVTGSVQLRVDDVTVDLPRLPATAGNDGVVVSALLKETGLVTVDPGFMNTASCTSDITYIDGDQGILLYRGYPIEQLAVLGELTVDEQVGDLEEGRVLGQLDGWVERVERHTHLHDNFKALIGAFPPNAHPMAVLSSAVSALPGYYPESVDPFDPATVELATVLLLAKAPTIAAYAHRRALGQQMIGPNRGMGFVADFLRMAFQPNWSLYEAD